MYEKIDPSSPILRYASGENVTNVIKNCQNIEELLTLRMEEITEFQENEGTIAETARHIEERLKYHKEVEEKESAAEMKYHTEFLMKKVDQEIKITDEEVAMLQQVTERNAALLKIPFGIQLNEKEIKEALKLTKEELVEEI